MQTGTGELSFLVGEQEIKDLPLNGRNYTDLAFLQPGVVAFPHRDGGSVVAHGVGASVNGLDPAVECVPARRHPPERFHQRPGREVRRARPWGRKPFANSGSKRTAIRPNTAAISADRSWWRRSRAGIPGRAASSSITATKPSTRPTTSTRGRSPTSCGISSGRRSAARSGRTGHSSSWATRVCARTSARSYRRWFPTARPGWAFCPTPRIQASCATSVLPPRCVRISTPSRCPTAHPSEGVSPSCGFPSIRRSIRISSRPASITI